MVWCWYQKNEWPFIRYFHNCFIKLMNVQCTGTMGLAAAQIDDDRSIMLWPKIVYTASKQIHTILARSLGRALAYAIHNTASNTMQNCPLFAILKTTFKNPYIKYRDVCPRITFKLAGLPGPILAKDYIFARILIKSLYIFTVLNSLFGCFWLANMQTLSKLRSARTKGWILADFSDNKAIPTLDQNINPHYAEENFRTI